MTNKPATRDLTLKQQRFALAYIANGGNASAAYREAYDAQQMSEGSIKVEASRLAANPNVSLTIQRLEQQAMIAAGNSPDRVVSRLMRLSESAEADGKYSAAVHAEHLLGRAADVPGFRRADAASQTNVSIRALQIVQQLPAGAPLGPQAWRVRLAGDGGADEDGRGTGSGLADDDGDGG
jgi:hypothetical protein